MKKLLFLFVGALFFANYAFSQDLTVCGNSVDLTAEVENYIDFTWMCDDADGTFSDEHSPNTTFTLASTAEYGNVSFHYTANVGGDVVSNTVIVRFLQRPNPNAGADDVVCGLGGELNGVWGLSPTDGYTPFCQWIVGEKPNPGAMVTWENNSQNDITGEVRVSDYGIYTFILKEINTTDDNATCFNSDTVTVEFLQTPVVNAGPDFSVCGLDFHLNAISSDTEGNNKTGIWTCIGTGTATFDDETSAYTTGSYSEYGSATFRWTESNHPHISTEYDFACMDYDDAVVTFYEAPSAALNMNVADTVACGLTFEFLRAVEPEGGMSGYWYEDNVTTQFGVGGIGAFNPVTGVTVSSYGRHDFYWIVYSGTEENPRLCIDTAGPWTINFIPRPSAQISNEQINFCGVVDGQLHVDFNGEGEGRWSSSVSSNVLWFDDPTDPNTEVHTAVYNSDNPAVPYYTLYWRVQSTESCADVDSVRVSFARVPSDSIMVVPPVCFGGPAMLTAYEDSLPLYNWDYGNGVLDSVVANSMTGEYRIFVHWEDRQDIHAVEYSFVNSWGCSSMGTVNIEEPNTGKIEASIAVSADIDINNLVAPDVHVLFVNTTNYGGTANAVCEWHFGDDSVEDNCDELVEHVYNAPDCYEPYLVVMNSEIPQCRDTARLDNCLSIAGIADFNVTDIDIYPSPVTDLLNITSSETISSIEIVNALGQVVLQMDVNADNAVCNVEELANGVYVVRIHSRSKSGVEVAEIRQKFVKE